MQPIHYYEDDDFVKKMIYSMAKNTDSKYTLSGHK